MRIDLVGNISYIRLYGGNLEIVMKFLADRKIFNDSDALTNWWESSDIFSRDPAVSTLFGLNFCLEVFFLTRTGE
jgi:hypothetical protein